MHRGGCVCQRRHNTFFFFPLSFLSKNYQFISSVFGDKKHIEKAQRQREQRGTWRINQTRNEVAGKEYQSRSNRSISGRNNESSLAGRSCGMHNSAAPPRFINRKTHPEALWDILVRPVLNLASPSRKQAPIWDKKENRPSEFKHMQQERRSGGAAEEEGL